MKITKIELVLFILFCMSLMLITIYGKTYATMLMFAFISYTLITIILWRFRTFSKTLKYISLFSLGGLVLLIISFVISIVVITSDFDYEVDATAYNTVVVLGAGINGDKISLLLEQRLEKCIDIVAMNPEIDVIVSGGQGEGEWITEALAMKRYLVGKGISETQIIMEDKSTTTYENIQYSSEIISKYNLSKEHVLIITNDFHLHRALKIARRLGVDADGVGSKTEMIILANYLSYEYMANIKDILVNNHDSK